MRNIANKGRRKGIELSRVNVIFVSSSSSSSRKILVLPARVTFDLNCYPSKWTIFNAAAWKIKTTPLEMWRKRFLFRFALTAPYRIEYLPMSQDSELIKFKVCNVRPTFYTNLKRASSNFTRSYIDIRQYPFCYSTIIRLSYLIMIPQLSYLTQQRVTRAKLPEP